MQMPVVVGDLVRVENAVDFFQLVPIWEERADEFSANRAVNNHVCSVNVLWTEFARHALCEGAQTMLGCLTALTTADA